MDLQQPCKLLNTVVGSSALSTGKFARKVLRLHGQLVYTNQSSSRLCKKLWILAKARGERLKKTCTPSSGRCTQVTRSQIRIFLLGVHPTSVRFWIVGHLPFSFVLKEAKISLLKMGSLVSFSHSENPVHWRLLVETELPTCRWL